MVVKAELHLHLEGSLPPSLVTKIAKRNGLVVPSDIFGENETFLWADFLHFLKVYDKASFVLRNAEDYREMTYDYLARTAQMGSIYTEMMVSPDHAALCGVSFEEHLAGVVQGIDDARRDHSIEGRIIMTCVRHFGVEKCINVAKNTVKYLHPYIVGFGMGGDEAGFPPAQFAKAYQIAHEAGLGCTVHAGEMVGPEGVWEAITHLPVTRIGHGVRSIEDPNLLAALRDRDITLEVCPGSNIALRVYPNFASHPLQKLRDAGVKVTLSTDDPPYFDTTLTREYAIAKEHFGFGENELLEMTRNSLEASFVDAVTREKLLAKVGI
ncbi:MAG: adenosine deaminase [Legionellales bacterium]|nr:adenosine deaminase [Legionellales bacterium]